MGEEFDLQCGILCQFFKVFFMLQDLLRIIFSLDWAMGGYFQFIWPPYAPVVSFYENSLLISVQEIYLILGFIIFFSIY